MTSKYWRKGKEPDHQVDEVFMIQATTIVVADKPGDQRSVSVGRVPGHGVWIGFEKNGDVREVCLTMEASKALKELLAEVLQETSVEVWKSA